MQCRLTSSRERPPRQEHRSATQTDPFPRVFAFRETNDLAEYVASDQRLELCSWLDSWLDSWLMSWLNDELIE